jgi:hypothetical protein
MNTCSKCGGTWESEGNPAIVHKTTVCTVCRHADLSLLDTSAGTKTEHSLEGLPIFFNPTVPPSMFVCVGPDLEHLELHGTQEAYAEIMGDPEKFALNVRMVRHVVAGLRAKKTRQQARLN